MQKLTKILWLLAIPLLNSPVCGQQRQVDVAGAAQVQLLLADEQVKLVHSQPWYVAGERLWFKAFVNKNSSRPPSRSLYVELRDANGTTLVSQRLIVEERMTHGDMLLPKELPSGSYTLLATTNWMKNFSDKQQYREQLLIVNSREVMALRGRTAALADQPLHVQFFPESASLLAGAPTKVAVVVTNAAGIGIAATGTIENKAGASIGTFQSDNSGIGQFLLKADHQEAYVAQVQAQGYQMQRIALPTAKPQGMALVVEEQSREGINLNVSNTTNWAYTLLAESGGKLYFSHKGSTAGRVSVPWKAKAGEAVRLLLLNPGGLVEAEQQVMLHESHAQIAVNTDRPHYGTRQQVTVTLQAVNALAANVAVSVTGTQQNFYRPLATGLGGRETASQAKQLAYAADEGLWEAIRHNKTEALYAREPFVEPFRREGVTGPFTRTNFSTVTDTAFVQALPESVVSYIEKHHTRTHINEIFGLTEPHAIAPLHRLPADRVFKLDNYITFNNVEEAIKEVATNVRLIKKKDRPIARLLYLAPGVKKMLKDEPLYLVDGVIVDDMKEILALDLHDIGSIEIAWTEEKLYAGNIPQLIDKGMFAVYTKSGEARERLKEKGYPVLFEQYSLSRNFVSASNAASTSSATNIPDFRQLAFWEPILQIGADGKTSFTFYTSDETGTFKVRVQGQTATGIPVSGEVEYEVKLMK